MATIKEGDRACAARGNHRRGRDMVYPILGVLLNAGVVGIAMSKVGQFRHARQIKGPSMEAHDDMSDEDKHRWQRIQRAQINTVEWFSLTTPVFLGGAIMSKKAFGPYGKYITRFLGVCSISNALYRYKYLQAYIDQADTRTKYFHEIEGIFWTALTVSIAACLNLIYRDVNCLVKVYKNRNE